eukprot:Skav226477  [mRNA]  locus=scaffold4441:63146:67791:- [translate_table: standard]
MQPWRTGLSGTPGLSADVRRLSDLIYAGLTSQPQDSPEAPAAKPCEEVEDQEILSHELGPLDASPQGVEETPEEAPGSLVHPEDVDSAELEELPEVSRELEKLEAAMPEPVEVTPPDGAALSYPTFTGPSNPSRPNSDGAPMDPALLEVPTGPEHVDSEPLGMENFEVDAPAEPCLADALYGSNPGAAQELEQEKHQEKVVASRDKQELEAFEAGQDRSDMAEAGEDRVYPPSSMLRMRLAAPSDPSDGECLGIKAGEPELPCQTVNHLKGVLFQAMSCQQRLEKNGAFKIAQVKTLHAMEFLLQQMREGVLGHVEGQAARSIQSQWRQHMRRMEQKKRQAERHAEGLAHKAELREQMRKLAEQRKQEQAPPAKASKVETTASQVAAASTSSQVLESGASDDTEEVLGKPEVAPGPPADGEILMGLLSPTKEGAEVDGEDELPTTETLTEGRLEGKTLLEQILPESMPRFFGELELFQLPKASSETEVSASQEAEERETLRAQMRALAEERQAQRAKAERRQAMKLLRQRVGPRPADSTLHGLLSRCDGDVNRAAMAFWNGLPFA